MKAVTRLLMGLCLVAFLPGCGAYWRTGLSPRRAQDVETREVALKYGLSSQMESRILALNPERVSGSDVQNVLSKAPAPRMILIHGGLHSVIDEMESFGGFLGGMGYPRSSIKLPGQGTYTFSCLERADMIAGMTAWYYEKEGLRPMMVGHSQGGFQVVKILKVLDQSPSRKVHVWNPLTWKKEDRWTITDPLSGKERPVAGFRLPYASSVGAGGATRVLPNQWGMVGNLRLIPNSVEEFTGFYKRRDILGSDVIGPANHARAKGSAKVRNVRLPTEYKHGQIPNTRHLARSRETKDWINNYRPPNKKFDAPTLNTSFSSNSDNILWAADVWYSIKKHWVLELQNLVRSRR